MKLDATTKPLGEGVFGARFLLVSYFPTYVAALYLLTLVWAGARGWNPPEGGQVSFTRAWRTATGLGLGQTLILLVLISLVAYLLHPLQSQLVLLLQGNPLPPSKGKWNPFSQRRRRDRLRRRSLLIQIQPPTPEEAQRIGAAAFLLRNRYPSADHLLRSTSLGNVLVAMEDTAGRFYGMDAAATWPRLYTVLGERVRALVDDRRNTLDATSRMAVTALWMAPVSLVLLWGAKEWALLALAPLAVAALAYAGAVQSAQSYSEAVHVAFDMHRGDLLTALRVRPPASLDAERQDAKTWSDFWRQGHPVPASALPLAVSGNELSVVHREQK